jgi:hypothetical protein
MATTYEPLVPVSEFGISAMSHSDLEAWAKTAGVTLRQDYADRSCVSLRDAYKLAEARRESESEYLRTQAERRAAHERAVKDLELALTAEYKRVTGIALVDGKHSHLTAGAARGEAVQRGIEACKALWMAAPAEVRQEVVSVYVPDGDGGWESINLGVGMPLSVITTTAHKTARHY